jgi:invasion protein IalB
MDCMSARWVGAMALACLIATPVIAEEADLPALTYSPWMKFCLADTCFIGRDGNLKAKGSDGHSIVDCGPVVSAVLIERNGDMKKTLRMTLPPRVNPERGVRVIIGQGQPIERSFTNCFANGCMADYDAGPELVDQLKREHMLVVEATDRAGSPISRTVPLAGFADAYVGPSREPKVREEFLSDPETQARLEREKREEEERKARCGAR